MGHSLHFRTNVRFTKRLHLFYIDTTNLIKLPEITSVTTSVKPLKIKHFTQFSQSQKRQKFHTKSQKPLKIQQNIEISSKSIIIRKYLTKNNSSPTLKTCQNTNKINHSGKKSNQFISSLTEITKSPNQIEK